VKARTIVWNQDKENMVGVCGSPAPAFCREQPRAQKGLGPHKKWPRTGTVDNYKNKVLHWRMRLEITTKGKGGKA